MFSPQWKKKNLYIEKICLNQEVSYPGEKTLHKFKVCYASLGRNLTKIDCIPVWCESIYKPFTALPIHIENAWENDKIKEQFRDNLESFICVIETHQVKHLNKNLKVGRSIPTGGINSFSFVMVSEENHIDVEPRREKNIAVKDVT